MATGSKQEFRIRDLCTRSVVLFPTRAQIIRDIKNIALQPGPNQIVIDGLAPTVEADSIKIEGSGSATISEVTIDLIPTRDVYEETYPSDSEDEDDDEESEEELEDESVKAITDQLQKLNGRLLDEKERINSAAQTLTILGNFGDSITENRISSDDLENFLKAYNVERAKVFNDHKAATAAEELIVEQINIQIKKKSKLAKERLKVQERAKKEKAKLLEKKLRQKAEIYKEKQRIKAERQSFWPKNTYRVTITLEPITATPGSSRRTSIDGDTIVNVNLASTSFHEPSESVAGEVSLSLSYVTYSAFWSPKYDLSLNSVKSTGSLDYGADLINTTSETWRDCKVVLSTSQTTNLGLNEIIPILHPWSVRLQKGPKVGDGALFSISETQAKRNQNITSSQAQKPRHLLFGVDNAVKDAWVQEKARELERKQIQRSSDVNEFVTRTAPQAPSAFGAAPGGGGVWPSRAAQEARRQDAIRNEPSFKRAKPSKGASRSARKLDFDDDEECEEREPSDGDQYLLQFTEEGTPAAAPNSLMFEEGKWSEEGLTTTYDVPGTKTLAPSNSTIKHKIAKISFTNVVFSHIIIGKLRQVAFLKARLRNNSKISLLNGPLGLTLDSSFLGQATFPRCSPGEVFSLPLGVDPAIQISYPKPTVRRSQSGIFSKEDSNIFTRNIIITNTKRNSPVHVTVLDQVPVSEDEKLRIEITSPQGLRFGGDKVRTGVNATDIKQVPARISSDVGTAKAARASVHSVESGQDIGKQGNWGVAEATAKGKGGEVSWAVKLNSGCAVKLSLEYEMTFPGGESVVNF